MSKQDKEYLVQRRLTMYPSAMWELLQCALASKSTRLEFAEWNLATAFRSRFYRFRMDAVEARVPGALRLSDFSVTGTDGLGARYHAARSAPGPITLEFNYTGSEAPSNEVVQPPRAVNSRSEPFVPEIDGFQVGREESRSDNSESAFDSVLDKWMKEKK